jgi:hypothetical protein
MLVYGSIFFEKRWIAGPSPALTQMVGTPDVVPIQ